MKRKVLFGLAGLFCVIGLGVLLYPTVRTAAFLQAEKSAIRQFEEYRAEGKLEAGQAVDTPEDYSQPVSDPDNTRTTEPHRAFPELWEACVRYNTLLPEIQGTGLNAQSMTVPALDLAKYDWEQEVFARLTVPTINLDVPLYLGASARNLDRGGAILGQTSLPIGGANTNCVIAGHRTWHGVVQFVALEQLCVGDRLFLTNPWETLVYEVMETKVITPDALEDIKIQKGRDLLTIFTCTRPNTRRYLLICERVS